MLRSEAAQERYQGGRCNPKKVSRTRWWVSRAQSDVACVVLDACVVETLSMKGLLFVHQGKRDEGQELVKKGIRNDLTSHIVWHVYGLIQKGEKKWEEALKSYTQALKCDRVRTSCIAQPLSKLMKLPVYQPIRITSQSCATRRLSKPICANMTRS